MDQAKKNNRDKSDNCHQSGMIDATGGIDISKKHILKAAEDSLRRLKPII